VRTLVALVQLYAGPARNPARALELARTAYALASHDGALSWKLGRIAFDLGDFAWAAPVLRAVARILPDEPDVLFDLAQATYSIGKVEEAQRAAQSALAMASFSKRRSEAMQFSSMISAAGNTSELESVAPAARTILAAQPDYVPALMVSARAREQEKKYAEAKEGYEKILGRYPLFAPAMRQLALLYVEQLGDDKKAEELALKARPSFPEDVELAYALGTISYRRGEYAEAIRLLNQSARKRGNHAETFFFLGLSEFQLKNPVESRMHLERAVHLKLPPQESNEAKRLLEQLSRAESGR
jgi:tetratricopeptide (TPR) repeat protein